MSAVWKWLSTCFTASRVPDYSQLVDQLDQHLWPAVCRRADELSAGQLGGYVWARARATGLLPARLPNIHSSSILDEVVGRFAARIADQYPQIGRRAA